MTNCVIPLIIAGTGIFALSRGVDVFSCLTKGARSGLDITLRILPALIGLMTAIYMLRSSGALDALSSVLGPLCRALGIPPEAVPLMLMRPISGSGALAVGSDIIARFGPDSLQGLTAAVMLGSTETTFYTIAVYFSAVGIKKTRWTIPAALCADITGLVTAALTVKYMT
ncbi:MAG: spore maturation protein [Oscillospiraceae bacterium]|nr:spore maturation protein [Oscillospiraceae bacterium]